MTSDTLMPVFVTDHFEVPLPSGHRFPMSKYRLLREAVIADGLVSERAIEVPEAASDAQLTAAHAPHYVEAVVTGTLDPATVRRIGFPWSVALVERSRRSVGATVAACRAALRTGVAVSLAGGTHHAGPDWGEGYCLFNDAAVAIRVLRREGLIRRVLVIDADVHQGNGTAACFRGDGSTYTFDLYGERNFPFTKVPSDHDVPLPDGTDDTGYLAALTTELPLAFEVARPDLVVYLAGADPYAGDRLGRLALTPAGLAERDRFVLAQCRSAGCPVAIVMAGGYAIPVTETVAIHATTVRLAAAHATATAGTGTGER